MTTPPPDPLDQLRAMVTLQEQGFRSQVPLIGPLIARFRELWNGVATKWYVRPLIQQQNAINQQQVALLSAQVAGLRDVVSRLAVDEARLHHQAVRQQDHDEWLIDLDHEQVSLTRSQAEFAVRLIQVERLLLEIEQRLARLEPIPGADSEGS
ncbi:MAG: hypothetical protein MUC51_00080 [Anaerolineae bacterium]|jgi:hypothetical protein|nr:hypothetical protein [Anaerolineae bacterium]